MDAEIGKLVQEVLEAELSAMQKVGLGTAVPEGFSALVASQVQNRLPKFTEETRTVFDDPYDSFSTDTEKRYVTPWR